MKINWGLGIALFYAAFMVILIFYVIKSTTYDHSLVIDNYYEQDIKYQEHFDKKQNTQQLKQQVKVTYDETGNSVSLYFPDEAKNVEGTVQFFRPSSKKRDMIKTIKLDEKGSMKVATHLLSPGRWKIILDWKDDQKTYYKEEDIFL